MTCLDALSVAEDALEVATDAVREDEAEDAVGVVPGVAAEGWPNKEPVYS